MSNFEASPAPLCDSCFSHLSSIEFIANNPPQSKGR
jgi:hypothetical protein